MPKPIPVDIIPSHVYLSADDQATLFGIGYPLTIAGGLSQAGQYLYEETVEVFGKLKKSLRFRVLGPNWAKSFVELTPTEAAFLGIKAPVAKTGELTTAAMVRLVGPVGEVIIEQGAIVPRPHLLCSDVEARDLYLTNGKIVAVDILSEKVKVIEEVIVRVHPTFRLRLELHQDWARDLWITRPTHARIRS